MNCPVRMSARTVAQKAHIKPGTAVAVLHPEPAVVQTLGLPGDVRFVSPGEAQLLLIFIGSRAQLDERLPQAVADLCPSAILGVFFRKGSKAAGLEVNRDDVWAAASALGLRPMGLVSVDETWALFRLRRGG